MPLDLIRESKMRAWTYKRLMDLVLILLSWPAAGGRRAVAVALKYERWPTLEKGTP